MNKLEQIIAVIDKAGLESNMKEMLQELVKTAYDMGRRDENLRIAKIVLEDFKKDGGEL